VTESLLEPRSVQLGVDPSKCSLCWDRGDGRKELTMGQACRVRTRELETRGMALRQTGIGWMSPGRESAQTARHRAHKQANK